LLRYCALGLPFVIDNRLIANYCVGGTELRSNDLVAHLADLQQSLAEKQQRLCAVTPRPITTPTPPPTPVPNATKRVEINRGHIGAVNVILTWNTEDDLDLSVTCPTGEEIYFNDKQKCGGTLDVDANSNSNRMNNPVENITWPDGAAPAGTYKVDVNPYTRRGSGGPIDFKVELLIKGQPKEEYTRRFDPGQGKMSIFQFTLPYVDRQQ
jgi:hypothetical protein